MWVLIGATSLYNGSFSTLFSLNGNKLSSNLSRIATVMWLFMALVITWTYTANLANLLTLPQLEISADQYAQALRSKEISALFLDLALAKIFLAEYCESFTMTGPTYKVGGFGFTFPTGLKFPSVMQAMLKVSESGKLRELENAMFASQKCIDMEPDDEPRSLSLSPSYFWVLFMFTGRTSSIALVIYIFCACMSLSEHKVIWKLMTVVLKHWGNQKRRFSRKVSDIAGTKPTNSPNAPMNCKLLNSRRSTEAIFLSSQEN
ncbi:hypothetical protein ACFX2I_030835 [Malus domestica]